MSDSTLTSTNAEAVKNGATEPSIRLGTPSEPASDTPNLRWCSKCESLVIPVSRDPNRCPTCKTFVVGNRSRSGDSPDLKLRARILAALLREYEPRTEPEQAQCRALANVIVKMEHVRVGGNEYGRLVSMLKDLKATLDDARASRQQPAEALPAMSPEQMLDVVDHLRDQIIATLEHDIAQAKQLEADRRAEAEAAIAKAQDPPAPSPPASSTEPTCPYCKEPVEHCRSMRETRLDNWRALHRDDPHEIKRRDEAATKEMYESLRRYGPARY
jgi:hypothetical protein